MALCATLAGLAAEIVAAAPVRAFFQALVERLYRRASRVASALVLTQPPSIERGEITDKGSINQRAVLLHRAALVEALHAGSDTSIIQPKKLGTA